MNHFKNVQIDSLIVSEVKSVFIFYNSHKKIRRSRMELFSRTNFCTVHVVFIEELRSQVKFSIHISPFKSNVQRISIWICLSENLLVYVQNYTKLFAQIIKRKLQHPYFTQESHYLTISIEYEVWVVFIPTPSLPIRMKRQLKYCEHSISHGVAHLTLCLFLVLKQRWSHWSSQKYAIKVSSNDYSNYKK